jgi:glycosyltransferase involved in cell wall biosynthesis
MTAAKRLSIILPSYNDIRIAEAIASVRRFDDVDSVKLVVIDGGSKAEVCDAILSLIREDDIFISERDEGIFDALNKGLDHCDTELIGWLGSDDLFSGQIPASEVIHALSDHDVFVAGTAMFNGQRVSRVTHSRPSSMRLVRFGLHNPHYSTFGRASLFRSQRFDTRLLAADIAYFIKIFSSRPRVHSSPLICTLQAEGGFSNRSYRRIMRINGQLFRVYAEETSVFVAPVSILIKLGYKVLSSLYYRIFRKDLTQLQVELRH